MVEAFLCRIFYGCMFVSFMRVDLCRWTFMDSWKDFIIIVLVASFLYPMKNLLGMLTRFAIYGMIAMALFSGTIKGWDDKLFAVGILSLPIRGNTSVADTTRKR
ncbi:hypothetical protein, partial [Bacillus tropicus]|uniref:hypothetical protein n=1 Tax=Bacillus tropicus TaxID=2026188 RepID=UPI003D1D8B38